MAGKDNKHVSCYSPKREEEEEGQEEPHRGIHQPHYPQQNMEQDQNSGNPLKRKKKNSGDLQTNTEELIIMRMAVIVVLAAVLLTYGVSTRIAMDPAEAGTVAVAVANDSLTLDMAPNSVDDMYQGCKDKMYQKLQEYLGNEKNTNPTFKAAWESSEQRYNRKFKNSKPFLGKERIVAIYYYTFGEGNVYLDFNDAVRTQGPQYNTFGYHALHFLLTDAIQTLKERRLSDLPEGEDGCVTSYRRVNKTFHQDVNTQLRFGSFTSTSMGQYSNKADRFGDKTCFEIYTCFGVDVSMYSKFENEGEVLIPPYEVFKVVGMKKRSDEKDLPCEVEYKLRSTKTVVSNLNCALFEKREL